MKPLIKKIAFAFLALVLTVFVLWITITFLIWLLQNLNRATKIAFSDFWFSNSGWNILLLSFLGVISFIGFVSWKKYKNSKDKIINDKGMAVKEFEKFVIKSKDLNLSWPTFAIAGKNSFINQKQTFYHIGAFDKKFADNVEKNKLSGSCLLIGSSGTFKTENVIKPTIWANVNSEIKSSMVITDPKGELYEQFKIKAEEKGFKVLKLNTLNSLDTNYWNPLSKIWDIYEEYKNLYFEDLKNNSDDNKVKIKFLISEIDEIIDLIATNISSINGSEIKSDNFFQAKGETFVKMYLMLPLDLNIKREDYVFENINKFAQDDLSIVLAIKEILPLWNLSSKYMADINEKIIDVTATLNSKQNALNSLQIFRNQNVANLTNFNDVDLTNFIEKPTIIFIQISDAVSSSNSSKIASLFCEILAYELNMYLSKKSITGFSKPILFILDEFGNLPKMEFMTQVFTLGRGKNIFALPVIQSKNQLNLIYREAKTNILFENAKAIIVTSIQDLETAEKLAKLVGKSIHKRKSITTHEKGQSTNISEMRDWDIDSGYYTHKEDSELIIQINSKKPFKTEFIPFYQNQMFKIENKKSDKNHVESRVYAKIINLWADVVPFEAKILWYINQNPKRLTPSFEMLYRVFGDNFYFEINKQKNYLKNFYKIHKIPCGFGFEKFLDPKMNIIEEEKPKIKLKSVFDFNALKEDGV